MARQRMIQQGIWTSEQFVSRSYPARLLFIGLMNFADDAGRHKSSPLKIKMEVFPAETFSEDAIKGLVKELVEVDLIEEYEVNGEMYLAYPTWTRWQKIQKRSIQHPDRNGIVSDPFQDSTVPIPVCERYRNGIGIDEQERKKEELERKKEELERKKEEEKEKSDSASSFSDYDSFDPVDLDHTTTSIDPHDHARELVRRWNSLPPEIILEEQKWPEDAIDAISRHVAESLLNPKLRPIISNLDALMIEIRRNTLLHRSTMWKLSALFGKTRAGDRYRLESLMEGGYIKNDSRASPKPPTNEDLEAKIEEARRRRQNEQH